MQGLKKCGRHQCAVNTPITTRHCDMAGAATDIHNSDFTHSILWLLRQEVINAMWSHVCMHTRLRMSVDVCAPERGQR